MVNRKKYWYIKKHTSFWIIGMMLVKVSPSLAQNFNNREVVPVWKSNSVLSPPNKNGYICYDKNIRCTIWNADKVVRIDPYKNIRFNFGNFNLAFPQGRPTISSNDKRFSVAIGMFINYDMSSYVGEGKRREGTKMAGWQGYLRRGRAIVQVRYDDFTLTVSPDIGRFFLLHHDLFDANLRYTGFKNTVIVWGITQPADTMYDTETSRDFTLAERPAVIDLFRNVAGGEPRVAINALHWSKRYLVSLAFTGQRLGKDFKNFQDGQIGGDARFAFRPLIKRDYEMHLGVSGTFALHGRNKLYSMLTNLETRMFPTNSFLRTGGIRGVNSVWAIGPEFAFRWKRFVVQSEYYSFFLQRSDAADGSSRPNLHFSGWYVSINRTIFGQPRSYNPARAVFVRPQGGYFNPAIGEWGALEWSARWSSMDLNRYTHRYDMHNQLMGAQGGTQNIASTGFNWYPSPHFRVMLDYSHVFSTPSRNPSKVYGHESNLIISRLQLTF